MDKIENLINKISNIYNNFNNSSIERDILLENIRNLYSEILSLNVENINSEKKHLAEIERQRLAEEQEKKHLAEIERQKLAEEQERKHLAEIERQKHAEEQERNRIVENHKKNHEKNLSKPADKKIVTIGESFQKGSMSLYDKLANNKPRAITDKIQESAISNILASIPIGDRFLYIKELFNNDSNLFQEAIKNIEEQNNFEDAVNFLMFNYKIEEENENLISFLQIVRRRFL